MAFNSLLNKTCDVQLLTETQDSAGQKVESWADASTGLACRIDPISAGKKTFPEEVYEKSSHRIFMKVPSGLTLNTENHRIVLDSSNYEIIFVAKYYDEIDANHLEVAVNLTI